MQTADRHAHAMECYSITSKRCGALLHWIHQVGLKKRWVSIRPRKVWLWGLWAFSMDHESPRLYTIRTRKKRLGTVKLLTLIDIELVWKAYPALKTVTKVCNYFITVCV